MMTRRGQKLSEGLHAEISLIVFDLPALQSTGSLCFVGYGILCDSNRDWVFEIFWGVFFKCGRFNRNLFRMVRVLLFRNGFITFGKSSRISIDSDKNGILNYLYVNYGFV